MLSVILVQHNNVGLTKQAIESFRAAVQTESEIILVDNASTEAQARTTFVNEQSVECIFNNENLGFGKANNLAAGKARGDILLFLNNDTISTMDFVTPVLKEFKDDASLGIAGPRLLNADGSFQLSGGDLPTIAVEARDKIVYGLVDRKNTAVREYAERQSLRNRKVEWVTGAALFIRAELFKRLGGFDERFFMFFEDKDLCLRARKEGSSVRYIPEASVVHLRGGSTGGLSKRIKAIYRNSQKAYYEKHRPWHERFLLNAYLSITSEEGPST